MPGERRHCKRHAGQRERTADRSALGPCTACACSRTCTQLPLPALAFAQAVATMFVTSLNTDCSLARKLYAAGYEIADHTMTHPHVSTG